MQQKIVLSRTYSPFPLNRRPYLAIGVVMVLFWLATVWGALPTRHSANLLKLLSLGGLALILIPRVLRLPHAYSSHSLNPYYQDIWLRLPRPVGRYVLAGVLSGVLLLASLYLTNAIFGSAKIAWHLWDWERLLDFLSHGLWEEVLFRGVVLSLCLRRAKKPIHGVLLAAGCFAVLHLNTYHLVRLLGMGVLWGWLTLKSRSLLPAVLSHGLYNIFLVLLPPQVPAGGTLAWLLVWQGIVLVCAFAAYGLAGWVMEENRQPLPLISLSIQLKHFFLPFGSFQGGIPTHPHIEQRACRQQHDIDLVNVYPGAHKILEPENTT